MPTEDALSVSPYLLQPLRTYEQALRDRMELRSLRERALETMRRGFAFQPFTQAAPGNGD